MGWKRFGTGFVSEKAAPIRTLRVRVDAGNTKRYRVCTVWQKGDKFTSSPALAQLFKSDKGHIGLYVTGRGMGFVKVGKNFTIQSSILVPLDAISKRPLRQLTAGMSIEISDIGGALVGLEK